MGASAELLEHAVPPVGAVAVGVRKNLLKLRPDETQTLNARYSKRASIPADRDELPIRCDTSRFGGFVSRKFFLGA